MSENPYGEQPGYGQQPGYGPQPGYGQQPGYQDPYAQPGYPQPQGKPWYTRWWLWLIAALVIAGAVAAVLLVALKPTFSLEKKLSQAIERGGDTASDVSCPSAITPSAGNVYTCTATVDGTSRSLRVRFTGDNRFVATYEQ